MQGKQITSEQLTVNEARTDFVLFSLRKCMKVVLFRLMLTAFIEMIRESFIINPRAELS